MYEACEFHRELRAVSSGLWRNSTGSARQAAVLDSRASMSARLLE